MRLRKRLWAALSVCLSLSMIPIPVEAAAHKIGDLAETNGGGTMKTYTEQTKNPVDAEIEIDGKKGSLHGTITINWPQNFKSTPKVTELHSLNAFFADAGDSVYFLPKLEDFPTDMEDTIAHTGGAGFAAVYGGFFNDEVVYSLANGSLYSSSEAELQTSKKVYSSTHNSRTLQKIGYDLLLKKEWADVTTSGKSVAGEYHAVSAKSETGLGSDALDAQTIIMDLYKALGEYYWDIKINFTSGIGENGEGSIFNSPLYQMLPGDIRAWDMGDGQMSDYAVDTFQGKTWIFATRTNPDLYWDACKKDLIFNGGSQNSRTVFKYAGEADSVTFTKQRTENITIGEFCEIARAMMELYGEPVVTESEQLMMIQNYGFSLPTDLTEAQSNAIRYMAAKGILDPTGIDFTQYITFDDLEELLIRINDEGSRLTLKNVEWNLNSVLYQNGYNTGTLEGVSDIENLDTVMTTATPYFDYFVESRDYVTNFVLDDDTLKGDKYTVVNDNLTLMKTATGDTPYNKVAEDSTGNSTMSNEVYFEYVGMTDDHFYHFRIDKKFATGSTVYIGYSPTRDKSLETSESIVGFDGTNSTSPVYVAKAHIPTTTEISANEQIFDDPLPYSYIGEVSLTSGLPAGINTTLNSSGPTDLYPNYTAGIEDSLVADDPQFFRYKSFQGVHLIDSNNNEINKKFIYKHNKNGYMTVQPRNNYFTGDKKDLTEDTVTFEFTYNYTAKDDKNNSITKTVTRKYTLHIINSAPSTKTADDPSTFTEVKKITPNQGEYVDRSPVAGGERRTFKLQGGGGIYTVDGASGAIKHYDLFGLPYTEKCYSVWREERTRELKYESLPDAVKETLSDNQIPVKLTDGIMDRLDMEMDNTVIDDHRYKWAREYDPRRAQQHILSGNKPNQIDTGEFYVQLADTSFQGVTFQLSLPFCEAGDFSAMKYGQESLESLFKSCWDEFGPTGNKTYKSYNGYSLEMLNKTADRVTCILGGTKVTGMDQFKKNFRGPTKKDISTTNSICYYNSATNDVLVDVNWLISNKYATKDSKIFNNTLRLVSKKYNVDAYIHNTGKTGGYIIVGETFIKLAPTEIGYIKTSSGVYVNMKALMGWCGNVGTLADQNGNMTLIMPTSTYDRMWSGSDKITINTLYGKQGSTVARYNGTTIPCISSYELANYMVVQSSTTDKNDAIFWWSPRYITPGSSSEWATLGGDSTEALNAFKNLTGLTPPSFDSSYYVMHYLPLRRSDVTSLGGGNQGSIVYLSKRVSNFDKNSKITGIYGYGYRVPSSKVNGDASGLSAALASIRDGTCPFPFRKISNGNWCNIMVNMFQENASKAPMEIQSLPSAMVTNQAASSNMIAKYDTKENKFKDTTETLETDPSKGKIIPAAVASFIAIKGTEYQKSDRMGKTSSAVYFGTQKPSHDSSGWMLGNLKLSSKNISLPLVHIRNNGTRVFVYPVNGMSLSATGLKSLDELLGDARELVDWDAYKFRRLVEKLDTASTIILIFILNLFPRIGMFAYLLLMIFAVMADNQIFILICDKIIDPIKILSLQKQDVHTIELKRTVIQSMLALAIFFIIMDGHLINFIVWCTKFGWVLANR